MSESLSSEKYDASEDEGSATESEQKKTRKKKDKEKKEGKKGNKTKKSKKRSQLTREVEEGGEEETSDLFFSSSSEQHITKTKEQMRQFSSSSSSFSLYELGGKPSSLSIETLLHISPSSSSSSSDLLYGFDSSSLDSSSSLEIDWTNEFYQKREKKDLELTIFRLDFVALARSIGKTIICEAFYPDEKKSIKPTEPSVKNIFEKSYLSQNILFQFSFDSLKLFGGSFYAANKMAKHELNMLNALSVLNEASSFILPLMALIDYRGFRLEALSFFPTSPESLVYGSCDGGKTIVCLNENFEKDLEPVMKTMNLKRHTVGFEDRSEVLFSPADIQGYFHDSKYFLMNVRRLMPPVAPDTKFLNGHLYSLFRKEFVSSYQHPLCSDAYSSFIRVDPLQEEHNQEADNATIHLFQKVIPEFAQHFLSSFQKSESLNVSTMLHNAGINFRYIGLVIRAFRDSQLESSFTLVAARALLVEATVRVLKNQINHLFRQKMLEIQQNAETPFWQTAIEFLNLVFSDKSESLEWWKNTLPSLLAKFFNLVWFFSEDPDFRTEIINSRDDLGRAHLLKKFCNLVGLVLNETGFKNLSQGKPIGLMDMLELNEKVKHFQSGIFETTELSMGQLRIFLEDGQSLSVGICPSSNVGEVIKMASKSLKKNDQELAIFEVDLKVDLSSTDPETISSLLNGKVSVAHRLSEDVNPWPHVVENKNNVLFLKEKEGKRVFENIKKKLPGFGEDLDSEGSKQAKRRRKIGSVSGLEEVGVESDFDDTTSLNNSDLSEEESVISTSGGEKGRVNKIFEQMNSTILSVDSKGRLYVAVLGGSDLDKKSYHLSIEFEKKSYFTTSRVGPITEWNEEFCFLVTDLDSECTLSFYEVDNKKKKTETLLSTFVTRVGDLTEGEIRREVMEIPIMKTRLKSRESQSSLGTDNSPPGKGLLYYHIVFEGDDTLGRYLPLERLMMEGKFLILEALCNVVLLEDAAWLTSPLLAILIWNERVMPFFRRALRKEVYGTQSVDLLFRGQNLLIKTLSLFAFQVGQEYLIELLGPFLKALEGEEREDETFPTGFELDPLKMEANESSETNLPYLLKWTWNLLQAIFKSVDTIPPAILHLCSYLKRCVIPVFPNGVVNALSGFFFLRFICPVLATPETLPGLRANPPSMKMRRLLVLVAKIVQNVASNVEFGDKEDYMKCCNPFIKEAVPKMSKFYTKISHKKGTKLPINLIKNPVQRNYYHLMHVAIVKHNIPELLPPKKGDLKGRLEAELAKLGKPKQDQKAVELLGYVDLEKIAENMKNPEIGIASFGLHSSEPQQKGKGPKRKPRIKFSSYDLIDWFCVNVPICHTRSDAVVLGNKLLEFQFILPCSPETLLFNDTDEMFEIADSVSTSVSGRTVLNLREGAPPKRGEEEEEEEESNPLTFSRDLLETIGAFFSQVSSLVENEIRPAMLDNIRDNPKFKVFILSTYKLRTMDPTTLTEENDVVAFWINIYHTLMLHAYVERGAPTSSRYLSKLLDTSSYSVAGQIFSLNEIEHAILRASLPTPKNAASLPGGGVVRFPKKDPKLHFAITKPIPLLSMALNCGAKSCPDIAVYTGANLHSALKKSAARYLSKSLSIRKEKDVIVVQIPKLLVWFSRDLGEDKKALISYLISFLNPDHSKYLPELSQVLKEKDKKAKIKIEPRPFEWVFSCNLSQIAVDT